MHDVRFVIARETAIRLVFRVIIVYSELPAFTAHLLVKVVGMEERLFVEDVRGSASVNGFKFLSPESKGTSPGCPILVGLSCHYVER